MNLQALTWIIMFMVMVMFMVMNIVMVMVIVMFMVMNIVMVMVIVMVHHGQSFTLVLQQKAPCRSFSALLSAHQPERNPGGHHDDGQWDVPDMIYVMQLYRTDMKHA